MTDIRRHSWGGWYLDRTNYVLGMPRPRGERYEVDLEQCTTSAEVLDWICQIAGKRWATDEVMAGLVRALDEVLQPQARLCSFGRSRRLTPAAVRALVDTSLQRGEYIGMRVSRFILSTPKSAMSKWPADP